MYMIMICNLNCGLARGASRCGFGLRRGLRLCRRVDFAAASASTVLVRPGGCQWSCLGPACYSDID